MVSDKFMVNSDADRMAAARYAGENFAWQQKLSRSDTLRLTLLVEETLGMVKAMVDEFYGQLWFTGKGTTCEIHLEATADVNPSVRRELLSVSSSGKNAAKRGFMAKLGEMVWNATHGIGDAMDAYGQETIRYGIVYNAGIITPSPDGIIPIWTLQSYKAGLAAQSERDDAIEAALDELEKSIVGKLADDVVVGVKGDRIELVITKDFKH